VRALARLATAVALGLLGACGSTPREPPAQTPAQQCRSPQLESLGAYALSLRQQNGAYLTAEKARLESQPPSVERDLRLALLLGQRGSPVYDPEGAARVLTQMSTGAPADPTGNALAEILYTTTAGKAPNCADSDEYRELAAQLSVEQQKRQETAARLEDMRQELDAERAQRAKLEQQLDALKSLEEQIKNRDAEPGR
jgi:DNA repair exonuclease SbcCD ATPase subunit